MRPTLYLFLLATLAVGSGAPGLRAGAAEPVVVQATTRHYDIAGRDAAGLWSSVQQRGPRQAGGRYAAYTDVRLRWSYRYDPQPVGCAVTSAQVQAQIEIQLPRWAPPADADPALVERWDRFARALQRHEQGHHDLGVESAWAIHRALTAVRAPSCRTIEAAAEEAARRVDREYGERARAYDRATGYGRHQGAYWSW